MIQVLPLLFLQVSVHLVFLLFSQPVYTLSFFVCFSLDEEEKNYDEI